MPVLRPIKNPAPIAVVGLGALGGLLASRWAEGGVRALCRTLPQERLLAREGLLILGPDGRRVGFRLKIRSLREEPKTRKCSAVFLCVKAHDLPRAISAVRPWVGPQTAVVGLQNGLGHEDLLRRAFGASSTVISSCFIAADRRSPSEFAHTGGDQVWLAENPSNRGAVQTARRRLEQAGWRVRVWGREDRLLWTKLCFNAATNPLAALCAASNGDLMSDPALRGVMLATLKEAVSVARRSGHRPLLADMAGLLCAAGRKAPHQRNSMLQDLQSGRKTEVGAILGPFLKAKRRRSRETELLERLSHLVKKLERRLSSSNGS